MSRGYDGMMVGYFGVVKHLLALADLSSQYLGRQSRVWLQAAHDTTYFGIHIVGQICCVDTRIGGQFLLVKALDCLQRVVGAHAVFLVGLYLKGCQIEQLGWRFLTLLFLDILHHEGMLPHLLQQCLTLGLLIECLNLSREQHVAVFGLEFPSVLGHEVLYLLLALHHQRQCRCLHTPHGEYLSVLTVLKRIQARGVYA